MSEKDKMNNEETSISLIDLIKVILNYKLMIIIITSLSILGVLIFCIISLKLPSDISPLPNKYTSTAQILISDSSETSSINSVLESSGLSSLAGIMGSSMKSNSSNSDLANHLVHSNYVLDRLNEKFNFTERYEIEKSPVVNTRNFVSKILKSSIDEDTKIFSVSFTDTDPYFAKNVVNYTVELLAKRFEELNLDKNKMAKENIEQNLSLTLETINSLQNRILEIQTSVSLISNPYTTPSVIKELEMIKLELDTQKNIYKQLKAQEKLLNIELSTKTPVFQILEYAEVPDKKSSPSRAKICIIVSFLSFLSSILLAFFINGLKKLSSDLKIK